MNRHLLDILVCPLCKGALVYQQKQKELICSFDRLAFPIINDIPVMIESEARQIGDDEE